MALRKKNAALFEVIRRDVQPQQRLKLPQWWTSSQAPDEDSPSSQRTGSWWAGLLGWLGDPLRVCMPRGVWLVLLLLVMTLPVMSFEMGRSPAGRFTAEQDVRSQQRMAEYRNRPVNESLMMQVEDEQAPVAELSSSRPVASDGPDRPADPRRAGMNYFCLVTVTEQHRPELERAAAFLRRNAVEARPLPAQGSPHLVQLIALKGFERPFSDPQANEYTNLLRSLGRIWKAEHGGASDWRDLYPVKYQPDS
jgi:hypothetical protein